MKPIIVSGIQPSGRLHIGNYLGALKNFVDLQNSGKYTCFFFIADLHSLTEAAVSSKEKEQQILDIAASFLAAGLNPKKSTLFIQSHIPAHSELAWILSCLTPMGELSRMTQFKEKSKKSGENAGLFTYPVLMAADVLLYDAQFVPVGADQLQHLELARTLARKFNARYSKTFIEPKPLMTNVPRLMSLDDPTKKMSKSNPNGCLFIDDAPNIIRKKIMAAVTDSGKEIIYAPKTKPGISNLLLIASSFSGLALAELEKQFKGRTYAGLKSYIADLVTLNLEKIRTAKTKLLKNKNFLVPFKTGGAAAAKIAEKKMRAVRKSIGLL